MKVGVKYCGGCNPYIDRKKVNDRVKEMLPPGKYTFEYFNFDDCKMFLAINGCGLNCAKFEQKNNVIIVAGSKVNGKECTEKELPAEVVKRLTTILEPD
jgi:hypothetical protein